MASEVVIGSEARAASWARTWGGEQGTSPSGGWAAVLKWRLCGEPVGSPRRGEHRAAQQGAWRGGIPAAWRETTSALRFAEGGAVDADRVALMAQSAEQGIDQGFVAQEVSPLGVVEIGRDDGRSPSIPLFH